MFIMGVFVFPLNVQASAEITPTISASITGTTLRIEVVANAHAVEAIFINNRRFNYRVDDVLNVDVRDYANDSERFSVYAIDFSGNRSNVVWLDNPTIEYTTPTPIPVPTETPMPTDIPESNPFTPDGQASVLDHATEDDGKEFYTFTTPYGNIFHLIIDHQRNNNNIYFLNAVTEADLMALAEESSNIGFAVPTQPPMEEDDDEAEPPPEPAGNDNMGTIIFVLLGVLAIGGAGYYFKIVKPKQQANASGDEDYEEDDEDYEMEFEDEEPEDEEVDQMDETE
jgi:hypothetical protein